MTSDPQEDRVERPETPEFLVVGVVTAPTGIRGEVKIKSLTEFPERFKSGARLFIGGKPYEVEASHTWKGSFFVLRLRGVETREEAERLRDALIEVPTGEAMPLPAGRFYYYQIIGLDVITTKGESIGKVTDIFSTGANDVYVVRDDGRETLVPAIREFVKSIDLDAGRMIIEPLVYHGEPE